MSRFVILEHDHPVLHWDLMLQAGDVLQTWRLALPPESGADAIEAVALPDHRVMYLDYEGPVSGGRGTVRCWDAGIFTEEANSTAASRRLYLQGIRVRGSVSLDWEGSAWRFRWLPA